MTLLEMKCCLKADKYFAKVIARNVVVVLIFVSTDVFGNVYTAREFEWLLRFMNRYTQAYFTTDENDVDVIMSNLTLKKID